MSPSSLPIVRLRPNAKPQAIRHGFPWVFANELVTDRRTRALAPGSLAILEDAERRAMGVVAVNPASKIICRMLDRNPQTEIGPDWLRARLWPLEGAMTAAGDGITIVPVDTLQDALDYLEALQPAELVAAAG